MTADLRRRLALLMTGTLGTLVALTVRQRQLAEPAASGLRATLVGVLAGVIAAVLLWRTYTFFAQRGARGRGGRRHAASRAPPQLVAQERSG